MATTTIGKELHDMFCANVKARRKSLGLTQVAVADRLGVSQPHYQGIETGKYSPGIETIAKVADALECEASYLLERHSLT